MKLRRRQSKERCRKSGLRESTAKTGGVESMPNGCSVAMQVGRWPHWPGGLCLAPSGLPRGPGPQSKDEKNKQS